MEILKQIKTEREYELALKKIETFFNAKPNTKEGDHLELLSQLIHEYEQKHYKIEAL